MLASYKQRQSRIDVPTPICEAVAIPFDVFHHLHLLRPDNTVDRRGGREQLANPSIPLQNTRFIDRGKLVYDTRRQGGEPALQIFELTIAVPYKVEPLIWHTDVQSIIDRLMDPVEKKLLIVEERFRLIVLSEGQPQERVQMLLILSHYQVADLEGRRVDYRHCWSFNTVSDSHHAMLPFFYTFHYVGFISHLLKEILQC